MRASLAREFHLHIRINIPAWGAREIAAGVQALCRFQPARPTAREQLASEIGHHAQGWMATPLASGRYAIGVALRSLGLTGKRVAVPAYVCPAVLAGIRSAEAVAVPIDCAPASFRFDRQSLEEAASTGSIDGVIATNTYGVDQEFEMLRSLGLPLLEDAAYQAGRLVDGVPCGTRGDTGVLSFNFKALTSVGGGVLLTRESADTFIRESSGGAREARRFVNYAIRAIARQRIPAFLPGAEAPSTSDRAPRHDLEEVTPGWISELQASIALVQWQSRDRLEATQRRNAGAIEDALSDGSTLCVVDGAMGTVAHLVPCLAGSAEAAHAVRSHLHRRGVQTEHAYPMTWNAPSMFPNARDLAARLALIPCNASLGESEITRVASALRSAIERVDAPAAVTAGEVSLR